MRRKSNKLEVSVEPRMGRETSIREKKTKCNDVSWYAKDPQLIKDAASLSFYEPLGLPAKTSVNARSVPGVMALEFIPTIGFVPGVGDSGIKNAAPINVAAKNFYAWIRHANSGSRNYDPVDLMIYALCAGDLYSYISALQRIYSLARDYQQTNRYYSFRLLTSLGVDPRAIIADLANLRYYINKLTTNAGIFALPKDWSLIARHCWMNASIFLDAPMRKAQTYVFVQRGFYKYSLYNSKGSATVEEFFNDDAGLTTEDLITFGEGLLSALNTQEDVGIMSGDILKAYGAEGLYHMPQIDADFHIEPLFSIEVLQQIHNATILPVLDDGTCLQEFIDNASVIQTDDGILQYKSTSLDFQGHSFTTDTFDEIKYNSILFDMVTDPVSPEQVMVASRLTNTFEQTSFEKPDAPDTTVEYIVTNCGSEVIIRACVSSLDTTVYLNTFAMNSDAVTVADLLKLLTPFSYSPRFYVFVEQIIGDNEQFVWAFDDIEFGTVDNYTVINERDLSRMHECAIISELSIPLSGLSRR